MVDTRAETFTAFLDAYGAGHPPRMVYERGGDFAEWQARFLGRLEALRGPLPARIEPEVEVVDAVGAEDHTRYVLRIPVSAFSTLPAYLLVPRGLSPGHRRPGLIAAHGHVKYGIDTLCGLRGMHEGDAARRAYAVYAVRAGFVVLCPAWWGWTCRDGHLDRIGQRDRCNVIQMAAAMYGINVLDLHVQDGQAALDVLSSWAEVDPARIGCMCNSYGGRMTMWLSIFDNRVRACVASGCMNTFRERSLKLSSCAIQYLPGLLQYGDVPELFSLIAPRPMQLQAGEADPLISPEDRDDMEAKVRRAYRLSGAESNFEYVRHAEGHLLMWDSAAPFLEKYLK